MHITDPIADMLTRIRNATSAKHETVDVPASNMKTILLMSNTLLTRQTPGLRRQRGPRARPCRS